MHFNPKPPVRRCSAHPAGDLENPGGGSPVLTDLAGRGPMVRYGFKDSNFNGEKRWPWWWSMRIGGVFHFQTKPGKSIYFSCILLRLKSASCVCSISNHSQYLCGKCMGCEKRNPLRVTTSYLAMVLFLWRWANLLGVSRLWTTPRLDFWHGQESMERLKERYTTPWSFSWFFPLRILKHMVLPADFPSNQLCAGILSAKLGLHAWQRRCPRHRTFGIYGAGGEPWLGCDQPRRMLTVNCWYTLL